MPYIEKRIQSGKLLEVEKYFATRHGQKIPRGANEHQTPEDMAKANERRSQKRLHRLICANFSRANDDLFATYTYGSSVTEAEAMKGERNLLDRIRRLRKRKGLSELKYIVITEKQGRWHHHIIMNGGLTLEEVKAVWGSRGARINLSLLDDTNSCEDLARYLTQQHKHKRGSDSPENIKQQRQKGQRRWHASRNLKQPVETVKVIARPPKPGEPKARKGYRLQPNWFFGCDVYGYVYSYAAYVREDRGGKDGTNERGGIPGRKPCANGKCGAAAAVCVGEDGKRCAP